MSGHQYSPFLEFVFNRLEEMSDQFVQELRTRTEFYQKIPLDGLSATAGMIIKTVLDAVATNSLQSLGPFVDKVLEQRVKVGLAFEEAAVIHVGLRKPLLRVAALAIDAKVEGAMDGLFRIDEGIVVMEQSLSRFFNRQMEQARWAAEESEQRYRWFFTNVPAMMHSINAERRLIDVSDSWLERLGYSREEVLGKNWTDFMTESSRAYANESVLPEFFRTGRCKNVHYQVITKNGDILDILLSAALARDASGTAMYSTAMLVDVTERMRAERALNESVAQREIIEAQDRTLRELSTPLIPVFDGVVVVPLIGAIDDIRAEQMRAVLLEGVMAHSARVAILDVTGVPTVNANVAQALTGAAQAVRLLGAEVVFTGIKPNAARAFVEIGADFQNVVTKGTLKDGIAYAMKRKW